MTRSHRHVSRALLGALFALTLVFATPAAAQYGGVSGLFVQPSEDTPGAADYSGLGCNGNEEVVLYLPGLPSAADDPTANTAVPGRIIAVTTSLDGSDPLLEGTFEFLGVFLPTELAAGVYEVHSRCGSLDLRVFVELGLDGTVTTDPDGGSPVLNPTDGSGTLPFTGGDPSRVLSLAGGLIAAGIGFLSIGRLRSKVAA